MTGDALGSTRVPCGFAAHDVTTDVRVVRLSPSDEGFRREALVMRDATGRLHVYLNRCRHLPITLDAGSRRFVGATSDDLVCGTHGARYRRTDGLCLWGPCNGQSLLRIPFEETTTEIVLLDGRA